MKRTKNIPNSILAIPAAAPAIPPNPRAAAIMEMIKKTAAQYSIDASFRQMLESVLNDLASVLVLFQNPVEFLDVGRFWKVVVETGLLEYCLVRPGSIAGNGD